MEMASATSSGQLFRTKHERQGTGIVNEKFKVLLGKETFNTK